MSNWFSRLFKGTPAKRENVSNLRPEQEGLYQQLENAAKQRGAGGAFGDTADYYRSNLSNDPADFAAFAAPQLRQYNEDIVPGISEQFAGMGAGGLSSSGFRNAQVQGATDLSERLGAIRAGLRENAARGLQGIGTQGLQSYSTNMETDPGSEGLLSMAAPAFGAAGTAMFGPAGGAAGSVLGQGVQNWFGGKGKRVASNTGWQGVPSQTSPSASPQIAPNQSQFGLPGFNPGMRRGY